MNRRLLGIGLLFVSVFACPAGKADAGVAETDFKKEPFFPIVGYNFLWRTNERIVREQAEMGLTLITLYDETELDWCARYGMKGIVYRPELDQLLRSPDDDALKRQIRQTVLQFRKHPAFFAMQYTDEPSKQVLPGYTQACGIIKKAAPEHMLYTNLFPSWSQPYQHGFENYREYLEAFCKLYSNHPKPLLVYDNYRCKDKRLRPEEQVASYLENLNTVRSLTQDYNMPFWVTVMGAAHDDFGEPSAADLDLQVFCALAYGAKGIGYFTTVSHPNMNFQGGPFNVLGDKTQTYWNMRELNYRVRRMAPVLNTLESAGCYFSLSLRDRMVFKNYPMHKPLPGKLVESLSSENGNCSFLVGEFKDDRGKNWVLIVNLSRTETARFQASLLHGKKLQSFNSYTGTLFPASYQDPWLRPGQGKLYQVID